MAFDSPALTGTLVELRPRTLLHFLGLTRKTGVLRVQVGTGQAAVWFRDGRVVGAGADGTSEVLDAVVDVLRLPQGKFGFEETAAICGGPAGRPVDEVLAEATELVMDWEDIAQVVPSLSVAVALCGEGDGEVRLSGDAWAVSVAVAGGQATPRRLAAHLGWPTLRVGRALVELVACGRAVLSPPPRVRSHSLTGKADAVLAAAERPLWPGQGQSQERWRTPWYDEGA